MMAVIAPIILPAGVKGDTSPYPTVVRVISDHHIVSGMDLNFSGCALCSATYIIAEEKKSAMAKRYKAATNELLSWLIADHRSSRAVE
tara:strand:- start:36 stop:299 length:264 start_codon:yes stop_codon:yes gene_type:complete